MRVKRSVSRILSLWRTPLPLAPRLVRSVKFVVSTNQRVAFPMAARVAQVLSEVRSVVGAPVERDDARIVNHLVADHQRTAASARCGARCRTARAAVIR